jgi:hypothetical protein
VVSESVASTARLRAGSPVASSSRWARWTNDLARPGAAIPENGGSFTSGMSVSGILEGAE